ncbi:hypothetical protein Ancab_014487, partial [Ancistrocladus abbreviatus]
EGQKDEDGVVEELEEGEVVVVEDGEKCAEEVEESGEVKDVRSEEDVTRRAGAQGEAEEPLETSLGLVLEPASLTYFGCSGEEDAGKDCGKH